MFDENITLIDALTITLICMLTVFIVLYLITIVIGLFRFIKDKQPSVEETKNEIQSKKLKIEDITDEDMMVAALVATIDYSNDTKKDIRLKSIKQIN